MKQKLYIIIIILSINSSAQEKFNFKGQLSGITSYSPDNDLDLFLGGRYIPEVSYTIKLDSLHRLDFNVAANMSASILFHPFEDSYSDASIDPYRAWTRYSGEQYEVRFGLQKIDFGSASILRPLQWFNQIDPRDPLQLTNGVYGVLGRYYFSNNANIWLWGLYGNKKVKGFEIIETEKHIPEFGGRVQLPIPKGEIALSYHHRTATSEGALIVPDYEKIPENRFGIDGKWDVEIGLWFEATQTIKNKDLGMLTNQSLLNVGADYTFGIGSGLNVTAEHLISSLNQKTFEFSNITNTTAVQANYPLGFFDILTAMYYYNWSSNNNTMFINYEHQFSKLSGYVILYYNPDTSQTIQDNELTNNFSGPGIRFMLVYNH
ncbi:MAG: hypothetical protein ACPGU9_05705 [Flavobacteriaceae bacterium]